eukprot:Tamp_04292.p2 GENE.Tamp_04292~~Tamp_04292.p2  ORF type:complete len:536 (-),score=104.90 Tamp_04292:1740-3122(-)
MPMDLSLAVLGDAGPQSFSTQELFGGKRSIIVGVAGAFEPKSTKELEALMGKLLDLRANGAELVACVSVNDPWVVKAWAKSEGVGSGNSTVQMLADGDGSFTRALGFMADEDALLGSRSKSYAVVLDEKGTCEYMVMESDGMADSVLGHLEFLKGTGAVPTVLSSKAAELASKMRVDGERAQAAMAAAYDKARSETVELGRVKNDFIAKLEMAGRQATVRLKTMGDMGLAAFMASGANATEEDAQATLNQLAADRLASGQKPDSLPEEVFLRTAPMNLAKRNAIEANRKQWGIGADPAKPQRIDVNLKWDTSSSMQAPPTPADTAAAAAASSSSSIALNKPSSSSSSTSSAAAASSLSAGERTSLGIIRGGRHRSAWKLSARRKKQQPACYVCKRDCAGKHIRQRVVFLEGAYNHWHHVAKSGEHREEALCSALHVFGNSFVQRRQRRAEPAFCHNVLPK